MADPKTQRAALLTACASSFLTPFMGSSVVVALPVIGRDLRLDAVALTWVSTTYLLAAAACLLPVGRAADLLGRKRLFVLGLLLDGLASLGCLLAPTAPALLAARVLQGLGGAMIFGTGVAILTSVFPPSERGRVLGLNTATVYTGLSVGPYLGGLLTSHCGWRAVFAVGVVLAWLAAAIAARNLPNEAPARRGERFDAVGALLYGPALAMTMFGFSRLPGHTGAVLLAGGVVTMLVFALWERRPAAPLMDTRLFVANRAFALSNLAALANYSATAASSFLLSLYLQHVKGLAPQQAGGLLLVQPVLQALFSPLAGRLSDRVEPRYVASTGMAFTSAGLLCLTVLDTGSSLAFVAACLALLGLGFALFSSPNANAIMSSVPPARYGVASSMLGTMRVTGQTLSMGIVAMALSARLGRQTIDPATWQPFLTAARHSYALFAALCAAGVAASLARGNVRERA